MPATKHSTASERHTQPEHTHDVAAVSHTQHQGLSSHEQSKFSEEQAREAREHKAHDDKAAEEKAHPEPVHASPDVTVSK